MASDALPSLNQVILEHVELRRRNAALEYEMPLANYLDPAAAQPASSAEAHADSEDTITGVIRLNVIEL
jgi:hypothetical protein